jgi:hypothetical protein
MFWLQFFLFFGFSYEFCVKFCITNNLLSFNFTFQFLVLGSTALWTQSLTLTKQVLYHLSHAPSHFWFSYFLRYGFSFCPGLASNHVPPTYVSSIVVVIERTTIPSLFIETNFLPRLYSNCNPPNIHFLRRLVRGISHRAWPIYLIQCCLVMGGD